MDTIVALQHSGEPRITAWDKGYVKTSEFQELYEFRASNFEKKNNYRSSFFDGILNAIVRVHSDDLLMISLTYSNEDRGFALVYEDTCIFYSGPMREIKRNWEK